MSQPGRVLFVEDSSDDVDLMLRAFRKNGITNEIDIAQDGAQALDILAQQYAQGSGRDLPLLTILDLNLPKINGIEVLRRIRADERTRTMPVVIMSTSKQQEEVNECYRLGANGYVCKPIAFDAFVETAAHLALFWLRTNVPPRI